MHNQSPAPLPTVQEIMGRMNIHAHNLFHNIKLNRSQLGEKKNLFASLVVSAVSLSLLKEQISQQEKKIQAPEIQNLHTYDLFVKQVADDVSLYSCELHALT